MADTDPKPPPSDVKTSAETLRDQRAAAQSAALTPSKPSAPPPYTGPLPKDPKAGPPYPPARPVDIDTKIDADSAAKRSMLPAPEEPVPVAESPEQAALRAERAEKEEYRVASSNLFAAFRSPDVALGDVPASILAALCMESLDEPHHMGRTEAIVWAADFKLHNPAAWQALRSENLVLFLDAMKGQHVDLPSSSALVEHAAVIRG